MSRDAASDALAARLLATFLVELDEQARDADAALIALERDAADAGALRALFRVMHTLKGAARAAGVPAIEARCHALEALLAEVRARKRALDAALLATLFDGVDALRRAAARLRAGVPPTDAALDAPGEEVEERGAVERAAVERAPVERAPVERETPPASAPPERAPTARPPVASAPVASAPDVAPDVIDRPAETARPASDAGDADAGPTPHATRPDATRPDATVRVSAARLDDLLGASGQLRTVSAAVAAQQEALRALQGALAAALQAARRSRGGRAAGENVARENVARENVAREAALVEALATLGRDAARLADEAEATTRDLARVTDDLAHGVRGLRVRPVADALEALPRVVRDVSAATGKRVRLALAGERLEADRAVLAPLGEALLHLVRNAVDHGIEPPAVRVARGKPPEGTVRIAAALLGDRLVVTVEDDGAGLDVDALRRRLAALGEPVPDDDRAVARRLFQGNVTSRATPDAISGRGVGLDAVRAALARARGGVDVTWRAGAGTTFTLDVPLTLASLRALLVRVGGAVGGPGGGHVAALPTAFVERLVRAAPDALRTAAGGAVLPDASGGAPLPWVPLARVLGAPLADRWTGDAPRPAVCLRVGARRVALAVDALLGEQELVVRPIVGRGARAVPHVSGAALLASGEVALVLDATAVAATATSASGMGAPAPALPDPSRDAATDAAGVTEGARGGAPRRRRVLVADDSITTRTLERSVLEAAGYEVLVAVDGADGWRVLQEEAVDVVVSDVEMPRMDGFALCAAVRASARLRELPVILVTALETPEDRARGLAVGADAYLGKSTFDQEGLLDAVRRLAGAPLAEPAGGAA